MALRVQMIGDANEAMRYYGETLNIRRDSLKILFPESSQVQVAKVRLVYEGKKLVPTDIDVLQLAVDSTRRAVPEVEVMFQ